MTRRAAALVITLLLPLTLAASDPRNDAVPCLGTHGGGDPPDLVAAVGRVSEEGSAATWRLTFAEPLRVPDPTGPPFRVDVVIRDPKVPAVAFGDYRDFNRIIRFDATRGDARLELLYVTEGGHTQFDPPVIDGDTMTIGMPGRLLLGADEFGPTAMQRLRWTVVVRDGGRCDLLGAGGPTRSGHVTGIRIGCRDDRDRDRRRGRDRRRRLRAAQASTVMPCSCWSSASSSSIPALILSRHHR